MEREQWFRRSRASEKFKSPYVPPATVDEIYELTCAAWGHQLVAPSGLLRWANPPTPGPNRPTADERRQDAVQGEPLRERWRRLLPGDRLALVRAQIIRLKEQDARRQERRRKHDAWLAEVRANPRSWRVDW